MVGIYLMAGFATAKSMNSGPGSINSGRGNALDRVKANQKALSIGDIEDEADLEDGSQFDIKRASSEIDRSVARESKEATFAQVSIGQGWATSDDEGYFTRIFWVQKTFVNVTKTQTVSGTGTVDFVDVEGGCWRISADGKNFELINLANEFKQDGLLVDFNGTIRTDMASTCQVGTLVEITSIANATEGTEESVTITTETMPGTETMKAMGALKIGSDLYRLTLDSQTNDSITFNVVSEKGKVNGTLTLDSDVSLIGFTVWSGKLDLDSGKNYDITAATKNSKVKGTAEVRKEIKEEDKDLDLKGNLNAAERGQGKKLGLFARIRAFFRGE